MPISVYSLSMSRDKSLTETGSTEVWLRPPLLSSSGGPTFLSQGWGQQMEDLMSELRRTGR